MCGVKTACGKTAPDAQLVMTKRVETAIRITATGCLYFRDGYSR
jgi:hypothetical protein